MGNKKYNLALIIPNLLMNGISVIMMKNYFAQNIPVELIEAGKIDGGGEFNIFRNVVLPLSLSIVVLYPFSGNTL